MWRLTPLFILFSSAFAYTVSNGVYFSTPQVAVTVTATHNIVLQLNTSRGLDRIVHVRQSLIDAVHSAPRNNAFTSHFTAELQGLSRTLNTYQQTLQAYIRTGQAAARRTKRTPLIGHLVATVFGLPTNEEIDDLVDQINKHEKKEKGVINQLVSTLSVTDKQVNRLTKASDKAALAVTALRGHVKKLDANLAKLDTNLILVETLNFLEFSVEKTITEITRLISILDRVRITRRIIPELLAPEDLEHILNLIQNHQSNLLYPATSKFIPIYYRIAEAFVKAVGEMYYIIVRIPLRTEPEYLLYTATPFYVPYYNSTWARKVDNIPRHLAVRKDQKSVFHLDDLNSCIQTDLSLICVPNHNMYTYDKETCLLQLLKGKENDTCDYTYTTNMSPYFTRMHQHWVGSVQQITKVEEVCDKVSESRTLVLESGVNSIPVREGCQILGETFSLPKFTVYGTTVQNVTVIYPPYKVLPEHHLKIPYLEFNRLEFVKPMKEQSLKFLAYTSQIHPHRITWHTYINTSAVILVFCLIVFIIICIKCRSRCYDFICNRTITHRRQTRPYTPQCPPPPANTPRVSPAQIINRLSALRVNQSSQTPSRPVQATPIPTKPPRVQLDIQIPTRPAPKPEPEYLEMKDLVRKEKYHKYLF